jgi:hypothetical protein
MIKGLQNFVQIVGTFASGLLEQWVHILGALEREQDSSSSSLSVFMKPVALPK